MVNGDVISNADVDNRARLFALSTGLPITQDVLDRLRQQITRQLIDERLRMQEVQRRKIVIQDKAIADAIHDIEARNGLPAGRSAARSSQRTASGQRTLVDQIRAQLGWTQVLREQLGDKVAITDAEIAERSGCWPSRSASRNTASARSSFRWMTPPTPPTRSVSPRR